MQDEQEQKIGEVLESVFWQGVEQGEFDYPGDGWTCDEELEQIKEILSEPKKDEQKNTDQLLKAIEKLNSVPEPEHNYAYFAGQEWVAKEVHEKEIAQARKDERQAVIKEVIGTLGEALPLIKEQLLAQLEKEV